MTDKNAQRIRDIDNREKSSLKKSFLPRPIQNHKVSLCIG